MAWSVMSTRSDGFVVTETEWNEIADNMAVISSHTHSGAAGQGSATLSTSINPWANYTPTLTNITIGTGTVVARWARMGKVIFAYVKITFAADTTVGGDIAISLPANANAPSVVAGEYQHTDANTGAFYVGGVSITGAQTAFEMFANTATTPNDATSPFTWATSDVLRAVITYESV